jgi:glycosyltransferase involved in cell wall biosynthesis
MQVDQARSAALVSTYPPTACGLATFTYNVRAAITGSGSAWRADVVRILEPDERSPNDEAVVGTWVLGDAASLRRSLRELTSYDVVILQHEFRLFGWPDGPAVLEFVAEVAAPLVVVLHTVQSDPTGNRREIMQHLLAASHAVVVQAEAAREVLCSTYGADPAKVIVIAHGAASNLTGPTVPGIPHPTVVTWGLLRPGKGIERAIAAFARIGDRSPAPVYVVAGQTHPKYLAADGESYRDQLRADAERLGVADRIRFEPDYQDQESLQALARTADVVLLPYDSRDQVSSGVLVEALAAGKPVVATRFPHAVELLSGGAGLLVDHDDVDAMAQALGRVLYEPGLAAKLSSAARREAEDLMWQAVGDRYLKLLDSVAGGSLAA